MNFLEDKACRMREENVGLRHELALLGRNG